MALRNKSHNLCSYSPEPRAEVYCLRLNFNISKLVYWTGASGRSSICFLRTFREARGIEGNKTPVGGREYVLLTTPYQYVFQSNFASEKTKTLKEQKKERNLTRNHMASMSSIEVAICRESLLNFRF